MTGIRGQRSVEGLLVDWSVAQPLPDRGLPVILLTKAQKAAELHAFVTTRDHTCRFPNCGQRAGWADRDHVVPRADGGETDCANLCCLCRSHRRLKTLARGWRFVMDDDGFLHVTTPSGVTRTTRPPGLRPPEPTESSPADAEPPPMTPPDDDPPPF